MVILGKSFYLEITFTQFLWLLYTKILTMFHRARDIVRWTPLRFKRTSLHIYQGFDFLANPSNQVSLIGVGYWWLEFCILIFSLFGVAEIYETCCDFIKFNTRSLSNWERRLAQSVYGDSINYNRVRIDNLGIIGPRQFNICYVSFYTINSWGTMSNHILIHELMHVRQYQSMGALYIPRALAAQKTAMGYDYGGIPALSAAIRSNQGLKAFNLEQQADIITDYYLIREGYRPQWGNGNRFDLHIYEHFLQEAKSGVQE